MTAPVFGTPDLRAKMARALDAAEKSFQGGNFGKARAAAALAGAYAAALSVPPEFIVEVESTEGETRYPEDMMADRIHMARRVTP